MKFTIEYEREEDGRWIAEIIELPGVMAYGNSPDDAMAHAESSRVASPSLIAWNMGKLRLNFQM